MCSVAWVNCVRTDVVKYRVTCCEDESRGWIQLFQYSIFQMPLVQKSRPKRD